MDNRKRPQAKNPARLREDAIKRAEQDKAGKEQVISDIRNSRIYKITRIIAMAYLVFLAIVIADLVIPYGSTEEIVASSKVSSKVNPGEGGSTLRISAITTTSGMKATFESTGKTLYMDPGDTIKVYKSKILGNMHSAEGNSPDKTYQATLTIKALFIVAFQCLFGFFSLAFLLMKRLEYKGFIYLVIVGDFALVAATTVLLLMQ
ncbi:MAG: hypothetical protein ACJ76F_03895 [Bacteroidia bacterium]